MENSSKYDLSDHGQKQAEKLIEEMGDDWRQTLEEGGHGGAGATYKKEDFEPNAKAQETLKNKGAHALTKKFDEKEFRAKWEMDRDKRRSKQNFEMANLMADIYKKQGDQPKAEEYERKADALADKYPDLGGTDRTKARDKGKSKLEEAKAKKAKEGSKVKGPEKSKEAGKKDSGKAGKEEKTKKPVEEKPITATVADAEKKLKGSATKPKKQPKVDQ